MKRILVFIILIVSSFSGFAQSPIGEGGKQVNFGVGLYSSGFPVYFGMDFGVHPDITLGGQVGLDLEFEYMTFAGRGDYHFNSLLEIPRDWDFYAGISVGFAADINDDHDHDHIHDHDHDHISGFDLGLQVGGRYYWSESWGVNLEFGGGIMLSGGRLGLSKRF